MGNLLSIQEIFMRGIFVWVENMDKENLLLKGVVIAMKEIGSSIR